MVNSSLKNAMSRRNHRERAQPLHRQRLGLLEKHGDYVLRARDYKSKQDRLRRLREKAAFRNKDEFYFGMVRGHTEGGVKVADRGHQALPTDVVEVLKSQDLGYVKVQIRKDEKAAEKIKTQLQITAPTSGKWDAAAELAEVEKLAEMGVVVGPVAGTSGSAKGTGKGKGKAPASGHVVFVDGREEFDCYGQEEAEVVAEAEEEIVDLGWNEPSSSKPRKKQAQTVAPLVDDVKASRSGRLALLADLSALLNRLRLLRQAEAKLATTKSLMGKGAAKKVREAGFVDDDTAPEDRNGERKRFEGKMWKWKLERRK
ncbi:hypothetical protein Q5752_003749 [Cryptotrichosporon argae]